jgi:phosphoglycerol transferase MdoB-like AlkP superfamily enzyme
MIDSPDNRGSYYRYLPSPRFVVWCVAAIVVAISAVPVSAGVLSGSNYLYFHVANDAGVKYDGYGNNTYYVGLQHRSAR